MSEYAICECGNCHKKVPKNEARQITCEKVVGRSSGSFKFYDSRRRSGNRNTYGYSTGRTYYRTGTTWICDDCYPSIRRQEARDRAAKGIILIALVGFGIWLFLSDHPVSKPESRPGETSIRSESSQSLSKVADFASAKSSEPRDGPANIDSDLSLRAAPATGPSAADIFARFSLASLQDGSAIQTKLGQLGYFSGTPDGVWGPMSRAALREFKLRNGLAKNDAWDAETASRLFSSTPNFAPQGLTTKLDLDGKYDWTYPPLDGAKLNPINRKDARKIQDKLKSRGLYTGSGDGIWGVSSRSALREFKSGAGLGTDDLWTSAVEGKLFND